MADREYIFELKKAAKKSGGDRYTCTVPAGVNWDIYFPQAISRVSGKAEDTIYVRVATEKEG